VRSGDIAEVRAYNCAMPAVDPEETRRYLAGLALAAEFEIQELRTAPIELKLRQLWALMGSAELFESQVQREAEACTVQDRWRRLYQALRV